MVTRWCQKITLKLENHINYACRPIPCNKTPGENSKAHQGSKPGIETSNKRVSERNHAKFNNNKNNILRHIHKTFMQSNWNKHLHQLMLKLERFQGMIFESRRRRCCCCCDCNCWSSSASCGSCAIVHHCVLRLHSLFHCYFFGIPATTATTTSPLPHNIYTLTTPVIRFQEEQRTQKHSILHKSHTLIDQLQEAA
jgi:hypothetical protein